MINLQYFFYLFNNRESNPCVSHKAHCFHPVFFQYLTKTKEESGIFISFASLGKLVNPSYLALLQAHIRTIMGSGKLSKFFPRGKQTQEKRIGLQLSREKCSVIATVDRETERHFSQQTEVPNNTKFITE